MSFTTQWFQDVIYHGFFPSDRHWKEKLSASFPLVRRPFTRGRLDKQLLCYCCFNVGGQMKLCGHCFSLFSFTHNNNNHREGRSQQRQRSEVTYSVTLTGRTPTECFREEHPRRTEHRRAHFHSHTCWLSLLFSIGLHFHSFLTLTISLFLWLNLNSKMSRSHFTPQSKEMTFCLK